VTGLLYGGSSQLVAQLVQVIAVILAVGIPSYIFFKILSAVKVLRSETAHELTGLDVPEMGAPGYASDDAVSYGGRRLGLPTISSRPPGLSTKPLGGD
jgi:Amt family ammonium transporter